jgi:hypothetical protein
LGWKDELPRWLEPGCIRPNEEWADISAWLTDDPVWSEAKVSWTNKRGTHRVKVFVKNAGGRVPGWKKDIQDISVSGPGDRYVKKYLVEILVSVYTELREIYDWNKQRKK